MNPEIEKILNKLKKSKFRSRFRLTQSDFDYIEKKGLNVIREHAYDFIERRLSPAEIKNDGKQTPMRGHPVFTAQHATATCCRGCLEKWHGMERERELSKGEIDFVVNLIMSWMANQ